MEGDEEVLIEGSVLHSYLKDNGYGPSNLETTQHVKKKSKIISGGCVPSQGKVPFWVEDHLNVIMKSGLMFDDHCSFVKAFFPASVATDSSILGMYALTITSWIGCLAGAGFLMKNSGYMAMSALAVGSLSLPIALYSTYALRAQRNIALSSQNLHSAMNGLGQLFLKLKKCMLIAQEADALQSKFKLPGIELKEFKKSVLYYSKEVVYRLSNLTTNLMEDIPLDGKVDATAYCMSKEEIELALAVDNEDDTLSLGTLKRVFDIYLLVQSEFLRRLALCYCPDMWLPRTRSQLLQFPTYYESLCKWCSQIQQKLEKAVKVYEAYGGTYGKKSKVKGTPAGSDARSDIYVAIRSASLHLQSVLARSRELEIPLETNYPDDEAESIVFLEGLHLSLKDMQKDLRTSQVFLDDALVHVLKTKSILEGVPFEGETADNPARSVKNDVKILKEIEPNPPVEDEVFEAVIKREEIEKKIEVLEEELTAREEKEQREKEKQKSLKVLSELKVVLKNKATEWKEREKIARQKKGCPVDDEDDSSDWLPTCNEKDWPLPRLKSSILNPRKKTVRRSSSQRSKAEQSDEEDEENKLVPPIPGTAFDSTLLAEAMKMSLAFANKRQEDCFGDSGDDNSS